MPNVLNTISIGSADRVVVSHPCSNSMVPPKIKALTKAHKFSFLALLNACVSLPKLTIQSKNQSALPCLSKEFAEHQAFPRPT